MEKYGGVNTVVNCAGVGVATRTLSKRGPHPLEQFQKVITVNLVGTFNVIRLAAEQMALGEPYNSSGERGKRLHSLGLVRGPIPPQAPIGWP